MPELHAYYGYPAVWLVMVLIIAGMLYAFRRRVQSSGQRRRLRWARARA
jgi:uncharacterized iron-regulated membrane protein